MNIPVFDKEKKEYLDFLYQRIRKSFCADEWDCIDCPYYDASEPTRECNKLTHEQMDSILIGEFHKYKAEREDKNNEAGEQK